MLLSILILRRNSPYEGVIIITSADTCNSAKAREI
jgi:hypothetical protein